MKGHKKFGKFLKIFFAILALIVISFFIAVFMADQIVEDRLRDFAKSQSSHTMTTFELSIES